MGVNDLSAINLEDDFSEAGSLAEASRWQLQRAGSLEVWASMRPSSTPGEVFVARLLWIQYPELPPSLKFRDPSTGRLDMPTAWPVVRGFRPASLDACVNWCAEGFNLHPEWRTDARLRWDSQGNVLLKVLRILQDELDDHFQGRFRG